jgi:hypothetical protein
LQAEVRMATNARPVISLPGPDRVPCIAVFSSSVVVPSVGNLSG